MTYLHKSSHYCKSILRPCKKKNENWIRQKWTECCYAGMKLVCAINIVISQCFLMGLFPVYARNPVTI